MKSRPLVPVQISAASTSEPYVLGSAIIDTGSCVCGIVPSVAERLKLPVLRVARMRSVFREPADVNVYGIRIQTVGGVVVQTEAIELNHHGNGCSEIALIGRDILTALTITEKGLQSFELSTVDSSRFTPMSA